MLDGDRSGSPASVRLLVSGYSGTMFSDSGAVGSAWTMKRGREICRRTRRTIPGGLRSAWSVLDQSLAIWRGNGGNRARSPAQGPIAAGKDCWGGKLTSGVSLLQFPSQVSKSMHRISLPLDQLSSEGCGSAKLYFIIVLQLSRSLSIPAGAVSVIERSGDVFSVWLHPHRCGIFCQPRRRARRSHLSAV